MSLRNTWLGAWTLWQREVVRFYRQPSRIVGALGSPFVFWLLVGSGIGKSFHSGASLAETGYLGFFFPGILLLILLFTAIFSTFSLIQDRREGFFQSVLVAPVPHVSFVFGKIMGGTTLAVIQAMLFLAVAPLAGIALSWGIFAKLTAVFWLNAFALTGLGFLIAWQFHSIQGFHAVMNLFLIPLWILSGALFPAEGASGWIQVVMKWNPLTYGMALIRDSLFPRAAAAPAWNFSLGVSILFAIALFLLSVVITAKRRVEDLG